MALKNIKKNLAPKKKLKWRPCLHDPTGWTNCRTNYRLDSWTTVYMIWLLIQPVGTIAINRRLPDSTVDATVGPTICPTVEQAPVHVLLLFGNPSKPSLLLAYTERPLLVLLYGPRLYALRFFSTLLLYGLRLYATAWLLHIERRPFKTFGDAGFRTRGLSHAKRTLYRWATSPTSLAAVQTKYIRTGSVIR